MRPMSAGMSSSRVGRTLTDIARVGKYNRTGGRERGEEEARLTVERTAPFSSPSALLHKEVAFG